ncbi:MAG TPA: DoxX family protein [Gemmatimonadales bacterium]|nr:DoxX family protein [Gemmatimonadales bacterium]
MQNIDVGALSAGLLVGRLVVGLGMAAHGSQKLFGWFGGHGLAGTAQFFESLGYRPGRIFATAAALGEFVSGLLIALGLLGPVGPALMLAVMVVAMMQHWRNGFFGMNDGIELPLLYAAAAIALAFTGPGVFSLDEALGLGRLSDPTIDGVALAVAVLGALATLGMRRPASVAH